MTSRSHVINILLFIDHSIGDSGGPLWVVLGKKYPTAFLIGVVSRGLNCANYNAPGFQNVLSLFLVFFNSEKSCHHKKMHKS